MDAVIFEARRIVALNPNRPAAIYVALRDGRILGVGTRHGLSTWGASRIDRGLADKVLMPGLVEGRRRVRAAGAPTHAAGFDMRSTRSDERGWA
jgi:hypothetical protein